jgi:hypothetical protein
MENFTPSDHLDSLSRATAGDAEELDLRQAVAREDWERVDELGWTPVLAALSRYWRSPPNPALHTVDLVAYADVLGDREPLGLVEALRALARAGELGKWRPGPAEFAAQLAVAREQRSAVAPGDRRAAEAARAAGVNAAVLAALELGETECACSPRPVDWTRDGRGVLRHDDPARHQRPGLDPGQVEDAREAAGQTLGEGSSADR